MPGCARGSRSRLAPLIVLGSRRSWRIATVAQKHVARAQIVLLTGRSRHAAIMRQAGCSKATVWRWQQRFATEGVDGLLHDKSRPPGIPPLPGRGRAGGHADVGASRRGDPLDGPGDGRDGGISLRSVQRIWAAHRLRPHRVSASSVQGPRVRRQAPGHRRAVRRPAGPCGRAVGRREEPDPGPRPHPARPADEEGQRRDDDLRLQAQRHHHPVRRASMCSTAR